MADFVLGLNAKIYYGADAAALAGMTELSNVRDVQFSSPRRSADVSTRANAGWASTAATLREATLTFQMVAKPNDAGLTAIKNAWLSASGTLELAALTGAKGVADSEGPKGTWSITNFSRSEELENAIVYDVEAQLATFDEWIEDGVEGV